MLSHQNIFPLRRSRPSVFSSLFDEFLSPHYKTYQQNTPSVFDVIQRVDEENNTAVTQMFLPGVTSEQVDVSVNSSASIINVVINVEEDTTNKFVQQVYSERVQRTFNMTSDYDVEQTTVDLTNGILTLTTSRMEKSPQSVKLPINTKQINEKK